MVRIYSKLLKCAQMSKFRGFAMFFLKNRFKTFKAIFSSNVFFRKCFDHKKLRQIGEDSA
jgi:hypothetical protein